MRSMKKLLCQNLRLNLIFSGFHELNRSFFLTKHHIICVWTKTQQLPQRQTASTFLYSAHRIYLHLICNQCLLLANLSLSICYNNKRVVTILFPSCKYFWFENYSFFNEVVFDAMVPRPLSTPVVLPPPSPGPRAVGEDSIFFFIIS